MDKLRTPAVIPLLPRGGLSDANAPDQPILHVLSSEEGHLVPPRTLAGLRLPHPGASPQMISDLLEALHHACETLPQATSAQKRLLVIGLLACLLSVCSLGCGMGRPPVLTLDQWEEQDRRTRSTGG